MTPDAYSRRWLLGRLGVATGIGIVGGSGPLLARARTAEAAGGVSEGSELTFGVSPQRGYESEDPTQYYEDWLGRTAFVANDYLFDEALYLDMPSWKIDRWTAWLDENEKRRMCWDCHIKEFATLEEAANGDIDEHFRSLGESLVAAGHEESYIRIVCEFDLDFTVNPQTDEEKQWFRQFWRRAADALRSVAGQEFTLVWNPSYDISDAAGYGEETWPGDEYVDMIGIDIYDLSWPQYEAGDQPTRAEQKAAWDQLSNYLDWFVEWGDTHDKPLCLPEWGVWSHEDEPHGGGDNPYFIQRMYEWMHAHDVAWHIYFEELDKHELYGPETQFPKASARFKQLFGSQPRDLDNDGLYEDVTGEGTADVVDVQALFTNRESISRRDDAAAFNFNGDTHETGPRKGEPKIDVVDIQRLFEMVTG